MTILPGPLPKPRGYLRSNFTRKCMIHSTWQLFWTSFRPFKCFVTRIAFMRPQLYGYSTIYVKACCFCRQRQIMTWISLRSHQEGQLIYYWQVVSDLLKISATDDIITKTDVDITRYKQLQDLNTVDFLRSFWTNILGYGQVCDK